MAVSLFLPAGFISVAIIWFFTLCLYNYSVHAEWHWKRLNPLILPIALYLINLPWIFFLFDKPVAIDLVLRKVHLFLIPLGLILVNKQISDRAFYFILSLFLVGCIVSSFV